MSDKQKRFYRVLKNGEDVAFGKTNDVIEYFKKECGWDCNYSEYLYIQHLIAQRLKGTPYRVLRHRNKYTLVYKGNVIEVGNNLQNMSYYTNKGVKFWKEHLNEKFEIGGYKILCDEEWH